MSRDERSGAARRLLGGTSGVRWLAPGAYGAFPACSRAKSASQSKRVVSAGLVSAEARAVYRCRKALLGRGRRGRGVCFAFPFLAKLITEAEVNTTRDAHEPDTRAQRDQAKIQD